MSGFAPHSKTVLKDVMQKLGDAKISESAVSCMNEVCSVVLSQAADVAVVDGCSKEHSHRSGHSTSGGDTAA